MNQKLTPLSIQKNSRRSLSSGDLSELKRNLTKLKTSSSAPRSATCQTCMHNTAQINQSLPSRTLECGARPQIKEIGAVFAQAAVFGLTSTATALRLLWALHNQQNYFSTEVGVLVLKYLMEGVVGGFISKKVVEFVCQDNSRIEFLSKHFGAQSNVLNTCLNAWSHLLAFALLGNTCLLLQSISNEFPDYPRPCCID